MPHTMVPKRVVKNKVKKSVHIRGVGRDNTSCGPHSICHV